MKNTIIWILVTCFLVGAVYRLVLSVQGAVERGHQESEMCIVWKHERNAEKFLDNNCTAYVRWNQDNN